MEPQMDRRILLTALLAAPLAAAFGLPAYMDAKPNLWHFAGRKTLARVTTEVSFALAGTLRGSGRFKVIAQNQSVWIDAITVHGPGGKTSTQTVRKNLPPGQRMEIDISESGSGDIWGVTLQVSYLPLSGEPAALLLWGEGGA
jgi:hypothetical protein